MKQYEKTIEDATAALALNPNYSKAIRRRAQAYESTQQDARALSDWTAICIIEEFKHQDSTDSVQRVLKRIAESKAIDKLSRKTRKLPSPNFVLAYLSSFRARPPPSLPEGATDADRDLVKAFEKIEEAEFNEAAELVDKAIEGDCRDMAIAVNYAGTFAFVRGDPEEALEDFNKSLEIDPNQSQVYIKRAAVQMEKGIHSNPSFPLMLSGWWSIGLMRG